MYLTCIDCSVQDITFGHTITQYLQYRQANQNEINVKNDPIKRMPYENLMNCIQNNVLVLQV